MKKLTCMNVLNELIHITTQYPTILPNRLKLGAIYYCFALMFFTLCIMYTMY